MNKSLCLACIMLGSSVIYSPLLKSQESQPLDSLLAGAQAIPMAEISVQATSVSTILADKKKVLLTEEDKTSYAQQVDSMLARFDLLMEDPRQKRYEEINSRELDALNNDWKKVSARLEQVQQEMTRQVESFENEKNSLRILLRRWNLTLENAEKQNAQKTVREQIRSTINDIEKFMGALDNDSGILQGYLIKFSEKLISSNQIIRSQQALIDKSTIQQFEFDKPVIWKDSLHARDTSLAEPGFFGANIPVIKGFLKDNIKKLQVHLALFILISVVLVSLFRRLQKIVDQKDEEYVARTRILMSKPMAASLMITFTITLSLYDNIPEAIRSLNAILILIPMTFLIAHNIPRTMRKYLYLLMLFVVLTLFHDLTYKEDLFTRLVLLLICAGSLASIISMIRDSAIREMAGTTVSRRLLYRLSYVVALMLVTAIFANIFGGVYMAEYFGISVLYAIVVAILVNAFIQVINAILIMIIYSRWISSLTVIRNFGPTVEKRLTGGVMLAGWIIWVVNVLKEFKIKDAVFAWLIKVFHAPIAIGSTQIDLLNIILFVFIIWMTVTISRMIRFFLEGDVFTRLKLKKGVPGAISLILRITIITVGFLIAIAAAGVQMEKLAILLGAFGVGIGFGLQNIFNNLISGIILAFERPINEGDIIELGELMGIVKEIGIRSSIIKTYDGSEVIVPNGNLISEQLINWTLSDQRRRGEVRVGVAYGTDPQKVLDLLLEAAGTNERVLDNPKPWAIFLGFGESSLDFRLLFWIADAETRLGIQSEVAVSVNRLINEAGIEIPFPQRDLHLRSADAKIFDRINAVDESISKKTGKDFPRAGKRQE